MFICIYKCLTRIEGLRGVCSPQLLPADVGLQQVGLLGQGEGLGEGQGEDVGGGAAKGQGGLRPLEQKKIVRKKSPKKYILGIFTRKKSPKQNAKKLEKNINKTKL